MFFFYRQPMIVLHTVYKINLNYELWHVLFYRVTLSAKLSKKRHKDTFASRSWTIFFLKDKLMQHFWLNLSSSYLLTSRTWALKKSACLGSFRNLITLQGRWDGKEFPLLQALNCFFEALPNWNVVDAQASNFLFWYLIGWHKWLVIRTPAICCIYTLLYKEKYVSKQWMKMKIQLL